MDLNILNDGIEKLIKKLQVWGESAIAQLPNLILAVVTLLIFWFMSRWIYKLVMRSLNKSHLNVNLKNLLASMAKITFFCLGIIVALGVLDLQKTVLSLLAGVGVLGLALGFAFRDLAANFVSGIMLAINSPFKNGDIVKIKNIQGSVIDIRLRDTLIRNFEGQDVFIPNKEFLSNEFHNYSSFGKRKITVELGVGYSDDQDGAVSLIQKTLNNNEDILKDPAPNTFISSLGDSCVNIEAHSWIKYPGQDFLKIRNDLISQVKSALDKDGFDIPFPIRTLEMGGSFEEIQKNLARSVKKKARSEDEKGLDQSAQH